MRTKMKRLKFRYIVILLLLVIASAPFVLWQLSSGRALDIVVMNKTFPLAADDSGKVRQLDYSKQRGLFWVINYLGIRNPATNRAYDGTADYYGNELASGRLSSKPFDRDGKVPDVVFVSDMYGTGNDRTHGTEPAGVSGMTKEEAGFVSTSYAKGATVVGEYNIAGEPTEDGVAKELEAVFGLRFTGLAGKFFSNLSSRDDVPGWIRTTYERQYGKKWKLTGAGIVIAGNDRIAVLQRGVDFTGASLQIGMTAGNVEAYGTKTVDYYNWFEIVEPDDPASVIAWYDLKATEKGGSQLKLFGLDSRFPAIVANQKDKKHAFYLAGDFTDYRGPDKIKPFVGAAKLYRYFSVDSEGDLSYFYWQFYVPFIAKVLDDVTPIEPTAAQASAETASDGTQFAAKTAGNAFEVYRQGAWHKLYAKGVDIGPTVPGGAVPDDPAFYRDWFEQIGDMNANTVSVYTLMPPAFYRALDVYNHDHSAQPLYLLQGISPTAAPPDDAAADVEYGAALKQAIANAIDAMHGRATVQSADGSGERAYRNDISDYVLGYLVDLGLKASHSATIDRSTAAAAFQGEYVTAGAGATPTEAWLASVMDDVYRYEQTSYRMQHPVGLVSSPELDRAYRGLFDPAGTPTGATVNIDRLEAGAKLHSGMFGAFDIPYDQAGLVTAGTGPAKLSLDGFRDYIGAMAASGRKHPVLVSAFGVPSGSGLTEREQGESIASMLRIVKNSGAMGALVYEWADEWGAGGRAEDGQWSRWHRWHDLTDRSQNYGILAMESPAPSEYAMTLRGQKPLNTFALTADESYLYLKAEFSELPDFNRNSIHIFLDTVDRKNGEYMVAPNVTENWSGAEFEIRIPNQDHADLLVIPEYNASKGSYSTSVSTAGIFERIIKQRSAAYVAKSGRTVQMQYEDASVLTSGDFADGASEFRFQEKTLTVRIPWSLLNFSDPSNLMVINVVKKDASRVRMTDGIVPSLFILAKQTNDVAYHFPESVKSSGYRTFLWHSWEAPRYVQRAKPSYDLVKEAFEE